MPRNGPTSLTKCYTVEQTIFAREVQMAKWLREARFFLHLDKRVPIVYIRGMPQTSIYFDNLSASLLTSWCPYARMGL